MIQLKNIIIGLFLLLFTINSSDACTNFLVTKGASVDGSTMITYNADAGGFMEPLVYIPAQKWEPNDSLEVYDWDTEKYLGKIKQAPETYLVIGNINEYQVSIGETTFTGRKELQDTNGIMDYGSLIRITLQRAKTAREAIKVMGDLVEENGYYSTGESFSIADPNEVWVLEMIGKGGKEKGAVWVAVKIPDGYVSAHANQARIRKFPLNDPENCIYSKDVISFAQANGYYDPKKDGDFSFVDAYCPLDPPSLLFCEGRVWSLFRNAAPSMNLSADYWRCVEGAEPYPLYIKPDKKLTVADVFDLFRDHFDGTEFDLKTSLAAEPYGNPVRWKGLTFKVEGDTTQYAWERPISTQQTAFSFVSQMRSWLPNEIGGVFWYGVDDNYTNVYIPIYCANLAPPPSSQGYSISEFSLNSAFWVFNLVANLAYNKFKFAYEDIKIVQSELENKFFAFQPAVESAAQELYKKDKNLAVQYLTDYSNSQFELSVVRWRQLWEDMVMKYNDGYINNVKEAGGRHPKSAGYSNEFLKRVVKERPGYHEVKWRKNKKD
ncbi:MAG: C69 family dipeptidase [Candidatus Kapabacteria bacterium]|nr:C69 family dipeptidase [Ignavibacteriota bacterium]MCW5883332.1 C69 family dipeptidase [Candidatus Kapabacteria bacterium]